MQFDGRRFGGVERLSLDLFRQMQRTGVSCGLTSFAVPSQFEVFGWPVQTLGSLRSCEKGFSSLVDIQQLFCQTFHGVLLLGAKARSQGARVTWGYHERQVELLHREGLFPYLWPLVDQLIAPSSYVLRDLEVPSHVEVIVEPPGVDLEVFLAPQLSLSTNEDEWVLGTVGNFSRQKQHLFLLDVLEEVQKQAPGAKLRVVATAVEGGVQKEFLEAVSGRGLERSVSWVSLQGDAVAREYRKMDVCLLPGVGEAFGLCHLEAMASGVPVISVSEGSRERLGPLCRFLFLAETGSSKSWAHAVLRSREMLGTERKQAQQFVSERYGQRQMQRWIEAVLS